MKFNVAVKFTVTVLLLVVKIAATRLRRGIKWSKKDIGKKGKKKFGRLIIN